MTNIKKKGKSKAKKLQFNKETIKDMTAKKAEQVRGGKPFTGSVVVCCKRS